MSNVVGVDTLLEGDLPAQVANYDSLAVFAAKTEEDWKTELSTTENNRWGVGGLLGGLFEGLAAGKPFVVALLEALVNQIFEGVAAVFDTVTQAFEGLAAGFSGKWRDILAAKQASDYANAQLAVMNRTIVDLFDAPAGNLSSTVWDINYSGAGAGTVAQDGSGNCWWNGFGGFARTAKCRFKTANTTTDRQVVSTVMPLRVQDPLLGDDSFLRLLGRMNSTNDTFVYAEIGNNTVALGCCVSGTRTEFVNHSITPSDGDSWDFLVGSATDDYRLRLKRNGIVVADYTDDSGGVHVSTISSSHRYVGFEMEAGSRLVFLAQTSPGTMAVFSANDQ